MIIGIVIAVVVLLAGAGTAAFLLLGGGGGSATSTPVETPGGTGTAATSQPFDPSPGDGGAIIVGETSSGTSQTVPELGGSTEGPSQTQGSAQDQEMEDYLQAADDVATLLLALDERIPELAQRINETAPKVPQAVWNELQVMMGRLDGALTSLAESGVPQGFEDSDAALGEAAMAMGNRIDATIMGIEALWGTGKVSSAAKYFDLGRQARDEYREYMKMYEELIPAF